MKNFIFSAVAVQSQKGYKTSERQHWRRSFVFIANFETTQLENVMFLLMLSINLSVKKIWNCYHHSLSLTSQMTLPFVLNYLLKLTRWINWYIRLVWSVEGPVLTEAVPPLMRFQSKLPLLVSFQRQRPKEKLKHYRKTSKRILS